MGWLFCIWNEKEEIAEVDALYAGSEVEVNIDTGSIKGSGRCSVNVTYNYSRLLILKKAGMENALNRYQDREVDQSLVDELKKIEVNLERMCAEVEPTGNYWNGKDPYNVLEFVRWFRDAAEELVARGGKFICWVH